ncbi:MAG: GNAT family N-acetyltransferase [Pseudodesulfovibrio sp.]
MSYRYAILTAQEALGFDAMTFPAYRKVLGGECVAAGAWFGGQPCGLALCAQGRAPTEAELLSLFVAPLHRLGGVGASLLALAETFLLAGGMDGVHATWTESMPGAAPFERVLAKRGWSKPRKRLLLLRERLDGPFGREFRKRADSFRSLRTTPRGCELSRWADLTPNDLAFIRSREGCPGWYSPPANPLREQHLIAPELSPVLRRHGEIAGWITVHRIARETVRMTDVFVRTDILRSTGLAADLIVRTIDRLVWTRIPNLTWGIEHDNAPLRDLCIRRLGDIAALAWSMGSHKTLCL